MDNRTVVFIDTPTSRVKLSDIQQLLSIRRKKVQEAVLLYGPLSHLPIKYPPSRSYKQYLLRLISLLKKDGVSTRYFNTSINDKTEILSIAEAPLCFVFSDTTPQIDEILEYSKELKIKFPESIMICGGPHSTVKPKDIITQGIDIVVCGEGDIAFRKLIHSLINKSSLKTLNISGIYTKYTQLDDNIQYAESFNHMDELPLPDYDSLPEGLSNYHAYLMSSRGCPFSCPYCFQGTDIYPFRTFSPIRFWVEINEIWKRVKNEYNFIHIADDNIVSIKDNRLESLLKERNIDIEAYYCGEIRIDACNKKNLNLLKELRFVQLNIGIESLDKRVQKSIGKEFTFETIIDRLEMIKEIFEGRVISKAYIMVGLPGEDINSVNLTSQRIISLLNSRILDLVSIRMYKPLPGTDIFENQENYKLKVEYNNYREFERYSFPPVHSMEDLSRMDIYLLYLMSEARITEKIENIYGLKYKEEYSLNSYNYTALIGKLI